MDFKIPIRQNFMQLLFVFLAFSLMVLVSYIFVDRIVERQIHSNADAVFRNAEAVIRADIREAEVTLLNTALSVLYRLERGQSPGEIGDYIRNLTQGLLMPENRVSGLINVQGYILGEYIDGQGWVPPDTYVPKERRWYTGAIEARGGIVRSAPYQEARTGKLIVAVSKSLRGSRGEDYGVLSVTMDMTVISDYVKNLQLAEGGYGMLVDQDLVIIAHPEEARLSRPLAEFSESHKKIAGDLAAGKSEITAVRSMSAEGVMVVLSFWRIFTGWYLGIATPVSAYYHAVYRMAQVLVLLGVAFMIILSFFLIRLGMDKMRSDEENRSKSSFLARMSHEIRTPMNSILGMAELIMRKENPPEIDEYITVISQAGHSLLAIINDILDFSKITSGQFKIELRKYRLSSMINDTINVIRMRILEKPVDFLVTVDGDIPAQLIGDDVRVRQILINLLNNAVKYTPQGYISLDIRKRNIDDRQLELILSVTDTGIGIREEDMKRLFSDFTRLDINSTQGIEGTGLGLAITYNLCHAMGGGVTVSSEYGKGSVFTASVVQSFEDTKKLAQIRRPEEARVLLFEDRPLFLQSVKDAFTNLGITPACSPTLSEFTAEFEQDNYDYAFVSSRYAMDCIHALGKSGSAIQLVIMVEMGDASIFREVKSVMMPVYSLSIANVINNISEGDAAKRQQPRFDFIAPAAKVLIVDDISSNLRVAKELMAPYKMEIRTCMSGAEAVDLVQKDRYDLVFMDHMMPGMDGLEAAAAIRALGAGDNGEYYRNLPVIALTANAVSGQREVFLQKGLNDFLAKPIEVKQLNAVLGQWVPAGKKIKTLPTAEEAETGEAADIRISGVDTGLGLRNVNGSVALYLDILTEFCRNLEEDLAIRIKTAREQGNAELYAAAMHALKGSSRSIGALDLGDAAEQLEKAAKRGGIEAIAQKTGDLMKDIRGLINGIHTAVAARKVELDSREAMDIAVLRLDALKDALLAMDIEAVNRILMEYVSLPMDAKTKEHITRIEQCILMFEYDRAVEEINQLI
jgi:signal transduction histidine kinase/CheY-like chemotaxis protein/HPt (histidine-containing phosphotransfer) domain-containing protein